MNLNMEDKAFKYEGIDNYGDESWVKENSSDVQDLEINGCVVDEGNHIGFEEGHEVYRRMLHADH